MAFFGQHEIIPSSDVFPASIIVPGNMTQEQFDLGMEKAGAYWYDAQRVPAAHGYLIHSGFIWTGWSVYRAGLDPAAAKSDVTPALVAANLSWSPKAGVVVIVDKTAAPFTTWMTNFFGDALKGGVWDTLFSWNSTEPYEPVRWLPSNASIGPETTHIAWVFWSGTSPTMKDSEAKLAKLGITNLYDSYDKVALYTDNKGSVVQMIFAVPNRAVKISDIRKVLGCADLRVSTRALFSNAGGTESSVVAENLADTVSAIVGSAASTTRAAANITGAASDMANSLFGDPEKVKFYLKVAGGMALGVAAVYVISHVTGWLRPGGAPKLPWGRGIRRTRAPRPSRSSSTSSYTPPSDGGPKLLTA